MMLLLLVLSLLRRLSVFADRRKIVLAPRHRRAGLATIVGGLGRQRWISSTRSRARLCSSTSPPWLFLHAEFACDNLRARVPIR